MEPGYFWGKNFESKWTEDQEQPSFNIKSSENLIIFKGLIKNWNSDLFSCTVCTK